jgi:hypothetical protein
MRGSAGTGGWEREPEGVLLGGKREGMEKTVLSLGESRSNGKKLRLRRLSLK